MDQRIRADHWYRLLASVLPLAGRDITLGSINGVLIQRTGDYWVMTATNRYVAGVARTALPADQDSPPDGTRIALRLDVAKDLAAALKRERTRSLAVRIEGDHNNQTLVLPELGRSIAESDYQFPVMMRNFESSFQAPKGDAPHHVIIDPEYVALFATASRLVKSRMVFHFSASWGIGITIGPDFRGIMMPLRPATFGDSWPEPFGDGWAEILEDA